MRTHEQNDRHKNGLHVHHGVLKAVTLCVLAFLLVVLGLLPISGVAAAEEAGEVPQEEPQEESREVPQEKPEGNPMDTGEQDGSQGNGSTEDYPAEDDPTLLDYVTAPEGEPKVAALDDGSGVQATNNGIPVLYLTTDGGDEAFSAMEASEDHSVTCTGKISLDVPDGYKGDYSSEVLADLNDLKLDYIRGRGNSTWQDAKKPYKFKLKKGADLLGMGSNKHWILLANSFDTTLMRNRLVSYMGDALGLAYTPQVVPVDLVVNGNYHGSYYLCEQVRIGSSRVDIDELTAADNTEPNVTGGYLLGMRPGEDEPLGNVIITNSKESFCGENPEFDSDDPGDELGTEAQKSYIAQFLQDTEDAILRVGVDDAEGAPWTDYMDARSAARYWWVQEFTTNIDGFRTPSTYLYKERGGKLYWGPLWDFDQSMGFTSGGIEGFGQQASVWLDRLRGLDPTYQQELRDAWDEYDAILEGIVCEGGVLDRYASELRASWEANHELWADPVIEEINPTVFDNEVEELRNWISARRAWVNAHIDPELTDLFCKLTFVVDGEVLETRYVYHNQGLYSLPEWPQKEGQVFTGWVTENGDSLDDGVVFDKDTIIEATYAPVDEAILGKDLYLSLYEVWCDLEEGSYTTRYVIMPDDAQEACATWTSSDESIATVNSYGVVTVHAVGDVTITGTLASGATASYELHVVATAGELEMDLTAIELERDAVTLKVGEYDQVRVRLLPQANELTSVIYEVADESVATVDECGVIRAVGTGVTTVTVYDPNNPDVCATYTVTVEESEGGEDPGKDPGEDPEEDPEQDPEENPEEDPESEPTDDPASKPEAKTAVLSFDLAGGTLDGKEGTVTIEAKVGETITLPGPPKRAGYVFVCWKGSSYAAGEEYKVEGDHHFTAQWKATPSSTPTSTGRTLTPSTGDVLPGTTALFAFVCGGVVLSALGLARRKA